MTDFKSPFGSVKIVTVFPSHDYALALYRRRVNIIDDTAAYYYENGSQWINNASVISATPRALIEALDVVLGRDKTKARAGVAVKGAASPHGVDPFTLRLTDSGEVAVHAPCGATLGVTVKEARGARAALKRCLA